mmetsp:Transcript_9751/g.16730  ORF Transcript_9751/g.16730 Transcript_9751/m.16730 type:complete len:224 (-) Transcript_9751:836-1507(-)
MQAVYPAIHREGLFVHVIEFFRHRSSIEAVRKLHHNLVQHPLHFGMDGRTVPLMELRCGCLRRSRRCFVRTRSRSASFRRRNTLFGRWERRRLEAFVELGRLLHPNPAERGGVVLGHDVESVRPPRHLDRKRKDGFRRKKDVAQTRKRTALARDLDEHRHFGARGGRAELVMPVAHFQVILVNLVVMQREATDLEPGRKVEHDFLKFLFEFRGKFLIERRILG